MCIGLQGEFFDGREPNREATSEELKMLQYNDQACDILFNGLCPKEFNKISQMWKVGVFVMIFWMEANGGGIEMSGWGMSRASK